MDADNNAVTPAHYKKQFGIETIDYLEAVCVGIPGDEAVAVGNAIKYLSRYRQKNPTNPKRDVEKALWYVQRLLTILEDKMHMESEDKAIRSGEIIYGVPQVDPNWLAEAIADSERRCDAMVPSPYEKNRKEDIEANAIVFPDPRQLHPALRGKPLGQTPTWK
jgi:hypothetical protein